MRRSTRVRGGFVGAVLLALVLVGGCSSGGDKASSKGYCDAVKDARAVYARIQGGDSSKATLDEFGKHMNTINDNMPPELAQSYAKLWNGDQYAQDDIDVYNKRECGLDPLGVIPTTSTP